MYMTSSDLEIGNDGGNEQYTGLRFINVDVPQGATITNAKLVFRADESDGTGSQLNIYIQAEDSDDAAPFQTNNSNLSARNFTTAMHTWADGTVPAWNAGTVYETPDISSLIQEVVDRAGWSSGNAVVLNLYSDLGESSERVADSYEGGYPAELVFDWTVPAVAAPIADFSPSATQVCNGNTINFTDNSNNNPTSWLWDFGDGNTSTSQNPSHTYAAAGVYTVTLTAYNSGGSDQVVQTDMITIDSQPNLVLSNDLSICSGESTTITASGAASYAWDNGLGNGNTHTVTPISQTTYSVVASNGSCQETGSIVISVDEPLTAGTSNSSSVCNSSASVDLNDILLGEDLGGSWTDLDASGALTGSSIDATVLSAGQSYDFEYTVGPNGACSADQSILTIDIVAQVDAGSLTSDNFVCEGTSSFDLFNSIQNYTAGGIWLDDDNTSQLSGNTLNSSGLNPGTYDFTYQINGGACGNDQITVSLNVIENPTITISADQEICQGESATISVSGAASYNWDNGLSSASQHTLSPSQTTTYTVTGTTNGCSSVSSSTITVNELPLVVLTPFEQDSICTIDDPIALPLGSPQGGVYSGAGIDGNNFSPQLSGEGEFEIVYTYTSAEGCANDSAQTIVVTSCLSVMNENLDIFSIYPNPASNKITIERENPSQFNMIRLFDAQGRCILEVNDTQNPVEIDVTQWAKGSYTIVFTDGLKRITQKIIIQ